MFSNNNNRIVSLEGNIGSGKSTLLEALKGSFKASETNIVFLDEPVDEWSSIRDINGKPMLELFYEDQAKHAFSFQMMAFISRLATLMKAMENNHDTIIVTERSLYTDKMVFAKMLFASNKISLENYSIYLKWFDTFIDCFKINQIVYVKTAPEICHARVSLRNRTGEDNIPLSYLTNCDVYHENMVSELCTTNNQLVLDGNIDINDVPTTLNTWIQQIKTFIRS